MKTFLKCLCIWQILHVIHFICDKEYANTARAWLPGAESVRLHVSAFNSAPDCKRLLSPIGLCSAAWSRTHLMCGSQSPHRCGYLLYFTITDSSLRLGIYDPNKNFHRILPSEQVSNKSANWGKNHYHKLLYQWWFNLKIG